MTMTSDSNNGKYEILRLMAVQGSSGADLGEVVALSLRQAAEVLALDGAAVYLWDYAGSVSFFANHAPTELVAARLAEIEEELFGRLRKERGLVSAYMTFGDNPPIQSFTLPLNYRQELFGAVIGIATGRGKLVSEDLFLEAFTGLLSLHALLRQQAVSGELSQSQVDQERLLAVKDTAVTVNHEVNNPLTAILGNVQLLLLHRKDLDDDLVAKLRTIEASAMRIRDVTQKLLRLTSARRVSYAEGTSMLDLTDDSSPNDKGDR